MTPKPAHVGFYQFLGGLLLLADVGLVALAILHAVTIDKFVVAALALPLVGAIALLRPQLLDRSVKAASRRWGHRA